VACPLTITTGRSGHPDVQEHERGASGHQQADGALSVFGENHRESLIFQHAFEGPADACFVVDDEHELA
jgi:hypothetical protein